MDNNSQNTEARPEIPLSGKVYGKTIYWGTIFSAVFTLIGQLVVFMTKESSLAPSVLLSRIWEGDTVSQIWAGTGVDRPANEHWYLSHLNTGEGLTMLGIALGVFVVIPAILACSFVLYTREKQILFGTLALIAALITIGSLIGLIQMPVA
ncbi:MAG: hypothetical protein R6U22_10730 [Desulfohalobiaceae bacterium]